MNLASRVSSMELPVISQLAFLHVLRRSLQIRSLYVEVNVGRLATVCQRCILCEMGP
jgi:hypothetical protein